MCHALLRDHADGMPIVLAIRCYIQFASSGQIETYPNPLFRSFCATFFDTMLAAASADERCTTTVAATTVATTTVATTTTPWTPAHDVDYNCTAAFGALYWQVGAAGGPAVLPVDATNAAFQARAAVYASRRVECMEVAHAWNEVRGLFRGSKSSDAHHTRPALTWFCARASTVDGTRSLSSECASNRATAC